jgi:hypothetical protein
VVLVLFPSAVNAANGRVSRTGDAYTATKNTRVELGVRTLHSKGNKKVLGGYNARLTLSQPAASGIVSGLDLKTGISDRNGEVLELFKFECAIVRPGLGFSSMVAPAPRDWHMDVHNRKLWKDQSAKLAGLTDWMET